MRLVLSILIVTAVLVLGLMGITMGISNSREYNIDKKCTCDCFDRKFKGVYFTENNQYKSFYFNMETQTAYAALWTIAYIILLFKYVDKALFNLWIGKLNWYVIIFGSIGLFSHFYNFWTFLNYINDRFYMYLYSQFFFSVTELIPGACIYALLAKGIIPNPNLINLSLGVLLMHLYQCMADQGIRHLFLGDEFEIHTFLRDGIFLIADGLTLLLIALHKRWELNDLFIITNYALMFKIIFNIGFYQ